MSMNRAWVSDLIQQQKQQKKLVDLPVVLGTKSYHFGAQHFWSGKRGSSVVDQQP